MLRTWKLLAVLACGTALGIAGCKHRCCRNDGTLPPIRPFAPVGPGSTIPPAGVPINPDGSGSLPPPALTPSTSGRPPQELLLPDPIAPGSTSSSKTADGVLGGPVKATTAEPPVSKPDATATASPSNGLPGFTQIKEGVATGRKPALDGFETLKKDGYKSVVFLYAPGADVAAVRDLAATRGFTFTAIETTPDKLTDAYEQLNKAIAGKTAAQPVYVFDDDGTRAAALWYLHFKSVDLESNDVAKIRAKSLGLADDSEFWPTIKQHMSK
ncbi:MAG TPA: hypothetical protein VGI99_08195 [Gemmataceae bacterium]